MNSEGSDNRFLRLDTVIFTTFIISFSRFRRWIRLIGDWGGYRSRSIWYRGTPARSERLSLRRVRAFTGLPAALATSALVGRGPGGEHAGCP